MENEIVNDAAAKVPFLKKITPYDKGGEAGKLKCVLGNGVVVEAVLDQISGENRVRAMWHGLSQKLGDSVSGLSKDKLFDLAEKDLRAIVAQLATADWDRKAVGGGKKVDGEIEINDLATVIAKLKKADFAAVLDVVQNAGQEQRDVWRKNAAIKAELADMIAKRAKAAAKESGGDFEFPI